MCEILFHTPLSLMCVFEQTDVVVVVLGSPLNHCAFSSFCAFFRFLYFVLLFVLLLLLGDFCCIAFVKTAIIVTSGTIGNMQQHFVFIDQPTMGILCASVCVYDCVHEPTDIQGCVFLCVNKQVVGTKAKLGQWLAQTGKNVKHFVQCQ